MKSDLGYTKDCNKVWKNEYYMVKNINKCE